MYFRPLGLKWALLYIENAKTWLLERPCVLCRSFCMMCNTTGLFSYFSSPMHDTQPPIACIIIFLHSLSHCCHLNFSIVTIPKDNIWYILEKSRNDYTVVWLRRFWCGSKVFNAYSYDIYNFFNLLQIKTRLKLKWL
jgi:hypothetical protein